MRASHSISAVLNRFAHDDEEEHCGLIGSRYATGDIEFIELPNVHDNPIDHFAIRVAAAKTEAAKHRLRIIGFFHTHPGDDPDGARPSGNDIGKCDLYPLNAVYHPYTRKLIWFNATGVIGRYHVRPRVRAWN